MSKFLVFLKNNWQEAGKWLIAAVFGLILGKACDRIWPEDPVVVKEVTDTIKIIHAISPLPRETDSLMKEQIQQQLLNIKLLNEYDSYIKQNKAIYQNNVKITSGVEDCSITQNIENGKQTITITMKIQDKTRNMKFTLQN